MYYGVTFFPVVAPEGERREEETDREKFVAQPCYRPDADPKQCHPEPYSLNFD